MKKVNIIIGRFQPITLGHLKIASALYKENELPTVWCLVSNKKFDAKHPFSDELISKEIDECLKGTNEYAGHIYIKNADIVKCAEILHSEDFEPILWGCGSDRYPSYKKQADRYKEMANLLPEFDCFEVNRTDDDISATKVREAIKTDNKEEFKKMMPKGSEKLFDDFKDQLMDVIKESSKESLIDYIENYNVIVE